MAFSRHAGGDTKCQRRRGRRVPANLGVLGVLGVLAPGDDPLATSEIRRCARDPERGGFLADRAEVLEADGHARDWTQAQGHTEALDRVADRAVRVEVDAVVADAPGEDRLR